MEIQFDILTNVSFIIEIFHSKSITTKDKLSQFKMQFKMEKRNYFYFGNL